MDPTVGKVLAHGDQGHLDFLGAPVGAAGHGCHEKACQAAGHVLVVPGAEVLELAVARPGIRRPDEVGLHHVGEAGSLHEGLEALDGLEGAAQLRGGVANVLDGFVHGAVRFEGAVVASGEEVAFLELEVASWL